jgi:hypothetical protein
VGVVRCFSKFPTNSLYTLINLEQKGNMTSLKVQADVNKPMIDMLGTMLVLKTGKLFAISSSSHKT